MFSLVKNFFTPPRFSTESFPNMGRTLHYICMAIPAALFHPMIIAATKISSESIIARHIAFAITTILASEFFLVILCLILNRLGKTILASIVLSFSFVIFTPSIVYCSGLGVHDMAMLTYGPTFVLASTFLDRKRYTMYSLLQLLGIGVLFLLELQKPATDFFSRAELNEDFVDAVAINIVTAFGAYLLAENMRSGFRTATKNAEAFNESRQRLELIFQTVPDGILIFDTDGKITFANRFAQETLELISSPGEADGYLLPAWKIIDSNGSDVPFLEYPFIKVRRTLESSFDNILHISFSDGRRKTLAMNIAPLLNERRQNQGCIASFRDISEQLRSEEELQMRRDQITSVTANLHSVVYRVHLVKSKMIKPLFISEGAKELLGYSPDEILKDIRKFMGSIHREDAPANLVLWRSLFENPRKFEIEYRTTTKSGELRWHRNSGTPVPQTDGSLLVDGFLSDVTERKKLEQELQMLHTAVNASTEVIFLTDINGTFLFANQCFTETYGYTPDEVIGKKTPRILKSGETKDSTYENFWKQLKQINTVTTIFINRSKDGRNIEVEESLSPIVDKDGSLQGYLAIQRDITERKQHEEAIHQSKKTESLSILAGGVAHEFNNLLTAILGRASQQKTKLDERTPMYQAFKKIEESAERASQLTKQLLAYSGRSRFEIRKVNFNDIIQQNIHYLEISEGKRSRIQCDLEPSLPMILADVHQMKQLLINCVTNAIEATEHGENVIILRTYSEAIGIETQAEWQKWTKSPMSLGRYIFIEFIDHGIGMNEETIEKIFDPFFSTKFTGRGLGLSAVLGIVQGHKGGIIVHSEAGKGTTFKIALPAILEPSHVSSERPIINETKKHRAVLVIDDEQMITELINDVYESEGIKVYGTSNVTETLSLFEKHHKDILFVILDLNIPGFSVHTIINRLVELDPNIQIVLSSGDSSQTIENFSQPRIITFLHKPFAPDDLITLYKHFA